MCAAYKYVSTCHEEVSMCHSIAAEATGFTWQSTIAGLAVDNTRKKGDTQRGVESTEQIGTLRKKKRKEYDIKDRFKKSTYYNKTASDLD